jgi:type III pantothenate kinase
MTPEPSPNLPHDATPPDFDPASFVAVAVGNTRTRAGVVSKWTLHDPAPIEHTDINAAARDLAALADKAAARDFVLSSVNPPVALPLADALAALGYEVHPFGRDMVVPIQHALDDASTVGQDRLLCALGAYSKARQACVIVDAGTAITVDFIDGSGVFQGGVIAPGLRMMLNALHQHTAALPEVELVRPDPARGPFGKDTKHAMLLGVRCAALGLVRYVTERYAEYYEAYPQIVATGGDAAFLFDGDDVVEHVVPDLQLHGIVEAGRVLLREDSPDEP